MSQKIKAVFKKGAFIPEQDCGLPDGSEVELIIEGPRTLTPEVKDPEERKRILKAMIERMKQNPIPADAPRFSRDELHERR
jgi:predicted DNA-binding antitoxin AbrB/MazE fold protein